MKIFVISRRADLARRRSVLEQFERVGLSFEFFDAVENIESQEGEFDGVDERLFSLNTYRSPLSGELGCYASHVSLWRKAVALDEPMMIFEDDCRLSADFSEAYAAVCDVITEFGFIRLEGFKRKVSLKLRQSSQVVRKLGEFDVHYLTDVPLCLAGYAVSPAAAAQLADAGRRIASPIDKFIQRTWEHRTPIYALAPACVATTQLADVSTIGERKLRRKRSIGVALQRAVYKLSGELQRHQFDKENLNALKGRCGQR